MYAQLCKRLSDSVSQFDSGKPVASGTTLGTGGGPQTFLDVLSKVCWEKFENRFKYYLVTGEDPVNGQEAVLTADDEERHHVVKQKMLGNLKFIGELYLLGQLDDPIIHNCILQLLGNDKVSADIQVRCQDLECLCQLIRTCGKSLDAGPGGNLMDQYFHKMTKDSQKHQVYPPRIRFMLRDVIDLRADQWMPRTALSQQPGPMPIHLLRGSTKEDDDREAASAEHHHRMLSRGGDRDPFGSGSPNRGGRDDRGNLYGGRGSGGRDPMRGGDSLMSSTDLFMSKIPGFNDMFNNLSLGTSSTSSLLPPPPLMHNNRFLRDNKDGGERDYRGGGGAGAGREGGYDRRAGGGEQRNNRDDYYHNNSGGGKGGGYRQNNSNNNNNGAGENRGNYGGRDNQYGGRGSGGSYRDQQQSQNNNSSSDRHNNNGSANNGGSYQRRGDAADENDQQQTRGGGGRDSQDNNGYAGRNSREGGRDQHRDREGGQRADGGEGRTNYYNNRSNSPYNNNNNNSGGSGSRENGHTGNNSNGGNRDYNRGGDRDGGGGYMNGGGFNNGQQSNYHRNRNNSTNQQGGNYNQNANAGGNYQNNRYNNNNLSGGGGGNTNKGGPPNGGGAAGMMNGGQQKDLAPRFKRTMMGAGGPGGVGGQRDNNYHGSNGAGMPERSGQSGVNNAMSSSTSSSASSGAGGGAGGQGEGGTPGAGVENLQMRPAANSLLFKANTMNVNKLPLSQPQQRVIPTNSMLANQQQQQQQGQQGQQEKEKVQQNGRDSSASPFRNSPMVVGKKDGGGLIILGRGGVMAADQQKTSEVGKDKEQQQQPQDSPVDVKAGKKKKDKGPSKEEVLKKFTEFLEESYFVRLVKGEETVEEDQLEAKVEQKVESPEAVVEGEGEADSEVKTEDKEVVVEEPKIVAVAVEREQTLEEIVKQYVDLKVPDKFVKDCLATLCSVSMEREMKDNADTVPSLTDLLMAENGTSAAVTGWWSLSAVERSVVFVDELKKHQKLGNNVAEAVKQLVHSVSTDTPKQLPCMSKWLAVAALREVYGLAELGALTDNGKYHPLMLDTLQRLNVGDAAAKRRLMEVFLAAKVDLLQVLPEGERNKEQLVAVLDERGLDFLCPLLKVQSQMWKQIQTDANPQQFYKWIKENVDAAFFVEEGFIQALVTVLLKQITQETTLPEGADLTKNPDKALIEKEKHTLQKYSAVLNAFLNSAKLQLIAIYALQVYCHSVDFPKGMLLRWFTALYDLNVVEEEAFLQWKEDLSEAFPGKQRALFQVNAWLMWLQEAESEEEEEDN